MKLYRLTKQEIGNAIVQHIATFHEGVSFFPYKIVSTDEDLSLPDQVTFHLEGIPKGTLSEDAKHAL